MASAERITGDARKLAEDVLEKNMPGGAGHGRS
jgi:hypothetical protein